MKKTDSILYLRRRLPLLAPLLGVVFAFMLVVPASAATVTIDLPITQNVINPCNGEVVDFNGVSHDVFHVTVDKSGGTHGALNFNMHATGTGETTHNSYLINEVFENQASSNVGQKQTVTNIIRAINQSTPSLSFTIQSISVFTINANGTVTASIELHAASCTG